MPRPVPVAPPEAPVSTAPVSTAPVSTAPPEEPVRTAPVPTARVPVRPVPARAEAARPAARTRVQQRRARGEARLKRALQLAAAVLLIVLVVALTVVLTGGRSRPRVSSAGPAGVARASGANLTDPGQATSFLAAAAPDIAAVTTYDYRHLDEALAAGLAVTTGRYQRAYKAALTGDLARTATAEHVVHTFEVLDLGIGAIDPQGTRAKVLVFGSQRVTDDSTGPRGRVTPITLCATIDRIGNRYLIADLVEGEDAGLPPGGPQLPVAARAARTEVVDMLTLRRASFGADLAKALAGAIEPLRSQLRGSAGATEQAMRRGGYDTSAAITATAVVRADTDTVTFLVAATQARTAGRAPRQAATSLRYEVTVTQTPEGWAASRVVSTDGPA